MMSQSNQLQWLPLQSAASAQNIRKSSAATAGRRETEAPQPKVLKNRIKTPVIARSRQAGRDSGSGTITLISESIKNENKFIMLKQQTKSTYQPKNQFGPKKAW